MTDSIVVASVTHCKIERIVGIDFRGTPYAKFQTPEGYFLCECWFEQGKPKIQIRSNAVEVSVMVNALETMSVIATFYSDGNCVVCRSDAPK